MWRLIDLDCQHWDDDEFDNICRCTVDRSQGQLLELKVTCFDRDYGFLNYAAHRSSQIRCLTLEGYDTMGTALTDAIKKLPQLEELHLIQMPLFSLKQLESIGICRPMLKSFTYNERKKHPQVEDDGTFSIGYGVAIGKTMPNLRHLRVWGQRTKNEGLEAILDGCPHLESLDLEECSGLVLDGALGKRCSDRIKVLSLPPSNSPCHIDSILDGDWDWDLDDRSESNMSNFVDDYFDPYSLF